MSTLPYDHPINQEAGAAPWEGGWNLARMEGLGIDRTPDEVHAEVEALRAPLALARVCADCGVILTTTYCEPCELARQRRHQWRD